MPAIPPVTELVTLLPEMILIAVGVIALVAAQFGDKSGSAAGLTTLAAIGTIAALLALFPAAGVGPDSVLNGSIIADQFSLFIRAVLYGGALIVVLGSGNYVSRFRLGAGEFYSLLLLAIAGGGFMAAAGSILTFYIGLELLSISSYVLAGLRLDDQQSNEASLKYFLNGALSSAILLFGFSWLFGLTGTVQLSAMADRLAAASIHPALLVMSLAFVIAGLGFKIATVPFHLWVPDVYQGSPTPVTAFLSVGSKGAALAATLRLFYLGLGPLSNSWTAYWALLAAITMTWGNVSALLQTNIKRMFGYSSIAQAGYLLVGLAVGSEMGIWAAMFYLLAYTFTNLGAFTVITAVANAGGSSEIEAFAGMGRRSPFLAGAMSVFFLSLVGVPFTAGFFGKFYLIAAAVRADLIWLAVLTALNSVVSVGYYFNVIRTMYFRGTGDPDPGVQAGGAATTAVAIALAATVVIGVLPQFLGWAQAAVLLP